MVTLRNVVGLGLLAQSVYSMNLDSKDGIEKASKALASDLIKFYKGNESGQIPGLLPETKMGTDGYYWYESGAFMGAYVDYWQLTGDDTYNDLVSKGIQWQGGKDNDFMPANQSASEGNDDQSVWALSALTAAEYGFPAADKGPEWIDLATAVWEEQRSRWDAEVKEDVCDGGLRWQIFPFNNGYGYKHTLSNALFFNIGARLARMTGNDTYADYASKTWEWLEASELINNKTWAVYDGGQAAQNCTEINKIQLSAGSASLAMGAAFMYNFTDGSNEWRKRTEDITSTTLKFFFKDGEFKEISCSKGTCPRDIVTQKALVHRWLAVTTQVAPFTANSVLPVLLTSAKGLKAEGNGKDALEQTLANFAVISNLLIADSSAPGTGNSTNGKKTDETKDSPSSTTSSGTSASATEAADNSAPKGTGSGSFLALCVIVLAFQWVW
ncbi:DFG5-like protein [Fusarium heterosporum]|uniref:Mannan endo-1,6-alpha-mannosidase n=1 Tax=Fusarium heterosporum TaxID=42747 RepID=A0A8H5U184_FUSHE|nr:DFG5-like protein [Fusarium heterosporum]